MPDQADAIWKEVATHILERNGAVTLCPLSLEDPQISNDQIFGSRLLGMSEQDITVEVPNSTEGRKLFEPGVRIFVVMVHHAQRLELTCRVLERIKFQVNANVQTIAYRISLPTHTGIVQRRAFYRAHVSAMPIKPVACMPLDPAMNRPIVKFRFQTHLVNISGGGMGLIVQKESLPSFRQSKMFACEINVTMDREQLQFALRAQAMHSTVGRKGDVYVGMAFVFDDPTHQRESVDKLVKYTAWVQREQLKNKHQKT